MDLFLARDVHACCSGHLLVFLDVARDRYFSAPKSAFAFDVLKRKLTAVGEGGERWRSRLLEQALVSSTDEAVVATPTIAPRPIQLPPEPAFVIALFRAARAVDKPGAFKWALKDLSSRRSSAKIDLDAGRREADRFRAWRPLWPRSFVCLHDTLALAWFLSWRGAPCEVVFGVQGEPFAAHCWAEMSDEVLNDDREYCASFDVILRI